MPREAVEPVGPGVALKKVVASRPVQGIVTVGSDNEIGHDVQTFCCGAGCQFTL